MKKIIVLPLLIVLLSLVISCKNENTAPNQSQNQVRPDSLKPSTETSAGTTTAPENATAGLWAEQVESGINLTVPEDWTPEDFNNVYKNINRKAIYADIVDAVLSGKQKAYNFFSDSVLRPDELKAILAKPNHGPGDISLIRIREKLAFDKESFRLQSTPNTLILYVNHLSNGEFHGYEPLFYVHIR